MDGITVISLEHAVAGPFCSRQLADLGARVIKIERPVGGDFARGYDERVEGLSSHFVWTNRSKESFTLNVKASGATKILEGLLENADVLLQNLAPGASHRLGLSYGHLCEEYPRLIVCDISGYGNSGSYKNRKAYDLLIQGESGFLSTTGHPGCEGLAKAGCSIADISAGMYAYTGILTALLQRGKTGKGSHVEISMLECMIEWMGYPLYYAYGGKEQPSRTGASHATIYPYSPFQTGDGKQILMGVQNEREWLVFCEQVLKMPQLLVDDRFSTNSKRSENRDTLKLMISKVFGSMSSDEVVSKLDSAGIANALVNNMEDVWFHPQLNERSHWTTVDSPAGNIRAAFPPARNNTYQPVMNAIPALGEHNKKILSELGYSESDIQQLLSDGVI